MRRTHRGFTLVELLVVIGIIALLISILLPSLNKARQAATYTKCLSNQRQLLLGMLMYTADNRGSFPGGQAMKAGGGGTTLLSVNSEVADIENPWALNSEDQRGPTWLLKYVKGSERSPLMFCPADPSTTQVYKYSVPPVVNARRTSYRYSKTFFYTPEQIFSAGTGGLGANAPQTPQKITAVRVPAKKVIIEDAENYHEKGKAEKIDQLATEKVFVTLAMGFVDGHVEKINTKDMFDTDVNYTGRSNGPYASVFVDASTAGVRGRDVK